MIPKGLGKIEEPCAVRIKLVDRYCRRCAGHGPIAFGERAVMGIIAAINILDDIDETAPAAIILVAVNEARFTWLGAWGRPFGPEYCQ